MLNDKAHALKMFHILFRKDADRVRKGETKRRQYSYCRKHCGMLEEEYVYCWYRITFSQKLNTNKIVEKGNRREVL